MILECSGTGRFFVFVTLVAVRIYLMGQRLVAGI